MEPPGACRTGPLLFRATALGPVRILTRVLTFSTSLSNSVIGTRVRISRYGKAAAWGAPRFYPRVDAPWVQRGVQPGRDAFAGSV